MIDLEWYQSFLAIYRSGTVSKAAEARFLSQPAVSQHLAALEAVVGQPLFHRLPRQMQPTERGKELYSQIAHALDTLDHTTHTLRAAATEHPLVRIGTPVEYFGDVALKQLAGLPMRFSIRLGVPEEVIPALEQGQLDLVIASQRWPAMSVDYRKLAEETFILIGAERSLPEHLQHTEPGPALESWLLEQPWISYGSELPIIRRFWQQSFNRRPLIRPALIIPDLRIMLQAVEHGYGITVLPQYLCRRSLAAERIRVLWQPSRPVVNQLWVATRRVDRAKPELQQICRALQAHAEIG
jgi:DNA-binding transcriptional LysR family regulator